MQVIINVAKDEDAQLILDTLQELEYEGEFESGIQVVTKGGGMERIHTQF